MGQGVFGVADLWAVVWGRRWTACLVAVVVITVAVGVATTRSPKYTATSTLLIDFHEATVTPPGGGVAPALQPNYMTTQLGIISSRRVAGEVVDRLELEADARWQTAFAQASQGQGSLREWIAANLLASLQVVQGSNSRLVEVRFTSSSPTEAAEVANAFAEAYRALTLELVTQPARREAAHLEAGLRELRQNVERAQHKLSAFQAEHGILSADQRLDVELERLKTLVAERSRAESAMQGVEARLQLVERLRAEGLSLDGLPETVGNDVVRSLKAQLATKEAEFAEISRRLGPGHPRYASAAAELESLRGNLHAELTEIARRSRHELDQSRAQVEALREVEQAQKTTVLDLRQQHDALPALVRELEGAQQAYQQGLAQVNQYLVQGRQSQTNVALLTPALPPHSAAGPGLKKIVPLAAVLGVLLGFGVALAMELVDRRLRRAEDLEGMSGGAFLGSLPTLKA